MADIDINYGHSLGSDEALKRVGAFEELLGKYGIKIKWSGSKGEFKAPGVSGSVHVSDSNVKVVVKLGMLAKAAGIKADKLKGSIEKRLVAAFEDGAG